MQNNNQDNFFKVFVKNEHPFYNVYTIHGNEQVRISSTTTEEQAEKNREFYEKWLASDSRYKG